MELRETLNIYWFVVEDITENTDEQPDEEIQKSREVSVQEFCLLELAGMSLSWPVGMNLEILQTLLFSVFM